MGRPPPTHGGNDCEGKPTVSGGGSTHKHSPSGGYSGGGYAELMDGLMGIGMRRRAGEGKELEQQNEIDGKGVVAEKEEMGVAIKKEESRRLVPAILSQGGWSGSGIGSIPPTPAASPSSSSRSAPATSRCRRQTGGTSRRTPR